MISVCLATRIPLIRQGLRYILEKTTDCIIVAAPLAPEEVLEVCGREPIAVLLLDGAFAPLGTAVLLERLRQQRRPVSVVLFQNHAASPEPDIRSLPVARMLRIDDSPEAFVQAVRDAARETRPSGGRLSCPAKHGYARCRCKEDPRLTTTEARVLQALARNRSSQEIADDLYISFRTVQKHRSNIVRKLGMHGNNALLAFAILHYASAQ